MILATCFFILWCLSPVASFGCSPLNTQPMIGNKFCVLGSFFPSARTVHFRRYFSAHAYDFSDEENNVYDEKEDDENDSDNDDSDAKESDWLQAELTLRNAPSQPHPDLEAEMIARICCRSLQWVDYPTERQGLARCFDFFTFECRKAVTARQGGQTVEWFCEYGLLSPALQPFMGAHRVDLGEMTLTPAQPPLRGGLASFPVVIQGASALSVQYPSGMDRAGVSSPPVTHMVIRLEQQRRPPNMGCWLVREVMDVQHAFAGDMGNAHVGG